MRYEASIFDTVLSQILIKNGFFRISGCGSPTDHRAFCPQAAVAKRSFAAVLREEPSAFDHFLLHKNWIVTLSRFSRQVCEIFGRECNHAVCQHVPLLKISGLKLINAQFKWISEAGYLLNNSYSYREQSVSKAKSEQHSDKAQKQYIQKKQSMH